MTDATKSDRELLELAAKAAGFSGIDFLAQDHRANVYDAEGRQSAWNPLADDGDALRLAVKLDLEVTPSGAWVGESNDKLAALVQSGCGIDAAEEHAGDQYAATRRAIVRVAAELGMAMPA